MNRHLPGQRREQISSSSPTESLRRSLLSNFSSFLDKLEFRLQTVEDLYYVCQIIGKSHLEKCERLFKRLMSIKQNVQKMRSLKLTVASAFEEWFRGSLEKKMGVAMVQLADIKQALEHLIGEQIRPEKFADRRAVHLDGIFGASWMGDRPWFGAEASNPGDVIFELLLSLGSQQVSFIDREGKERMVNVAQNFNVMGTFGRIYPAKDVDTGERFAFKRIMPITHATGTLDELRRRTENEERVWRRLDHPNILKYVGICRFKDSTVGYNPPLVGPEVHLTLEFDHLVSPFVAHGTLYDYLRATQSPAYESILAAIASALMAVHEAGIVHGDLKLDNVLWDGDHQRPLLCDFGLAKELSQNTGDTLAGAGTAYFMSPERLQQRSGRSMEDDVWAFGCLMAQVLRRGEEPWAYDISQREELLRSMKNGIFVTPFAANEAEQGSAAWNLIASCWEVDPNLRPEMQEVSQRLAAMNDGKHAAGV